jgi:hypothetical protein
MLPVATLEGGTEYDGRREPVDHVLESSRRIVHDSFSELAAPRQKIQMVQIVARQSDVTPSVHRFDLSDVPFIFIFGLREIHNRHPAPNPPVLDGISARDENTIILVRGNNEHSLGSSDTVPNPIYMNPTETPQANRCSRPEKHPRQEKRF